MTNTKNRRFSIKDIIIILACVILMATTMGVVNIALSIFYPVVSLDLGVTRASFALTGTITALSSMVAALFWGFYYSRKPLHTAMAISTVVIGLAFLGMSAAQNLNHFYAMALVIGISYGGISIIPVSTIITRHFTSNTGFALSTALAGSGLGAMILNPVLNNLVSSAGWKVGYQLLAIVSFTVTLPVAILVTQLTKDEFLAKPAPSGAHNATQGVSPFKQAWFWIFLLGSFLAGITGGGVLANLPTYLKDINFSVSRVSFITSAYAGSLVIGKFILGVLYDKLGGKKATTIVGVLMVLSLALVPFIEIPVLLILMIIFIGVGLAKGTVSITWLTNFFFSKDQYSKYYGPVQFANSFGIAVGVPAIAAALENLANPKYVWIALALLSAVMVIFFRSAIRGNQKMKASVISSARES